ncbi:S-adenosyl-L-methionine-dependent methyltransferases superfamily protein [Actinidia rufa]|uniref:S-adenosyl-L-methionine-dependent methyltransferases superfamily protein n=1 Tax=Actinidia rufa TaxID=165716 RepID=A0A7J0DK43_9ERIC|nr:S-adenosyl-L-methionine-dependent methyltransferases superfamily protein [Actinidia rufa]
MEDRSRGGGRGSGDGVVVVVERGGMIGVEWEPWRAAGRAKLPRLQHWLAKPAVSQTQTGLISFPIFRSTNAFLSLAFTKNVPAGRGRLMKCLSLAIPPPTTTTHPSLLHDIASNHHKRIAKVVLKKGKTQLFKDGSPMVYSGAVDRIIGRPPPKTGDIVLVADGTEKPIGWGMYNSISMFCVRLMQLEQEVARDPSCALDVEKLLETRIHEATQMRRSLGLPSSITSAYRLVNSEGDGRAPQRLKAKGAVRRARGASKWVRHNHFDEARASCNSHICSSAKLKSAHRETQI